MSFFLNHLLWVTIGVILLVLCLAVFLVWVLHRIFHDEPVITPVSVVVVNVILAALVGLWLNNLWGMRRDRDGRLWSLQEQHLERLRSTFKTESNALVGVASYFHSEGFIDDGHGSPALLEEERVFALTSADVLSFDVQNHYPAYVSAKRELAQRVERHDKEFADVLALTERELDVRPTSWLVPRKLALTFIEQAFGKGPGFILHSSAGQLSVTYWGASIGGQGSPEPGLVSAHKKYKAFRPSKTLALRLQELRASSNELEQRAERLSKEALLMAERTTLPGRCAFVQVPAEP